MAKQQVVIVGAGFGGLAAARALAKTDVDVVVIDQRNHHTFQPLLYQVATAGLDVDDICYVTRGIFHRQSNARAMQAAVIGIDTITQEVLLDVGEPVHYDQLVLALGAITADFGVPGVADHAVGLKSAADAMHVRDRILGSFERASRSNDQAERDAATSVVVVGGGPTGVEMAGGLAELFDRVLTRDFPELADTKPRVVLVEGQARLLGSFADKLGATAARRLRSMGVDVRTSTAVASVSADAVEFGDGEAIATDTVVWAAGIRAHPLGAALGFETTRGGRVVVDESMRVPGEQNVFVIGDLAAATLPDGSLVPQVAPAAIQQGEYVADLIERGATSSDAAFAYRDKGSMATIGRNAAVVEFPNGRTMQGFVGWLAWLVLHLVMLIGFRNRANVLVNWAWNYLTWDRGSRIIVEADPIAAKPDESQVR